MKKHKIVLIASLAKENGLIGSGMKIPWRHREDLIYFKNQTINKPIIMGRKTAESIGKNLEKRINIVLTTKNDFNIEGMVKAKDIATAIEKAKQYYNNNAGEIMIIGGGDIFRQTIDIADKILLTWITNLAEIKNLAGIENLSKTIKENSVTKSHLSEDIFFPLPLAPEWKIISKKPAKKSPKDDCCGIFCVYEKK